VYEACVSNLVMTASIYWQSSLSLQESCCYMWTNQVATDVTFKVGESQATVKSHRFILMCRSSVFQVMSYVAIMSIFNSLVNASHLWVIRSGLWIDTYLFLLIRPTRRLH